MAQPTPNSALTLPFSPQSLFSPHPRTMPVLTLSQTATPFPFALLGAATFIQSTLAGDVSVSWDRDGKTLLDGQELADDVVLSKLGDLLKGKEVHSKFSTLLLSLL